MKFSCHHVWKEDFRSRFEPFVNLGPDNLSKLSVLGYSHPMLRCHGLNGACASIVGQALVANNLRVLSAWSCCSCSTTWPSSGSTGLSSPAMSPARLDEVLETACNSAMPGDQIKKNSSCEFSLQALAHMTTSIYFKGTILIKKSQKN